MFSSFPVNAHAICRALVLLLVVSLLLPSQAAQATKLRIAAVLSDTVVSSPATDVLPAIQRVGLPPLTFVPPGVAASATPLSAVVQQQTAGGQLLSQGRPASASDVGCWGSSVPICFPANLANDGKRETHWETTFNGVPTRPAPNQAQTSVASLSSTGNIEWWQVDLGVSYTITKVVTIWSVYPTDIYPNSYSIETGLTENSLSSLVPNKATSFGETTDTVQGSGRFVRVTSNWTNEARIQEVEVYGILDLPSDQNTTPEQCPCDGTQIPKGQPFNTRTGFLWTGATDMVVQTPGPAIRWERTYSSRAINEVTTPLGNGWQHNYNTRLILPGASGSEDGNVIILTPKANRFRFQDMGDGLYKALPGIYSTLVSANGVYTQTLRSQEQFIFDATGRLDSTRDPQG